MADRQQLCTEIRELIIDVVGLDDMTPEEIAFDDPLFGDDLGLDSIDALDIALELEKRYQVRVKPDQKAREVFYSVATLAEMVETLLASPPAGEE